MTTNAELIRHIQELKKIRPRKDWVLLTKEQIFSQYPVPEVQPRKISWAWFFQPKPAFAALMSLIFLAGTFVLAQNSLPGDPLYAIKKIKERGQAVFVSEEELPRYNLEIANKRLEELTEIAQTNQVRKLAPAIEEYQVSVSEATENLKQIKEPGKNPKIIKEVAFQTEKIEENKQKVEALGVVVDETEALENSTAQLIEKTIEVWEKEPLNKKQEEFLMEARVYFEGVEYYKASQALEMVYLLSYPQE